MYRPEQFDENDPDVITRLMADFPLATIVAQTKEGLVAHHIPLLLEQDHHLIGHIAKANTLHEDLEDGAEVLVIFRAEDAYISPNYYPTKASDHRHVPTWNYQVVHCYGTINFDHSVKTKTAIVGKLTKHFEHRHFSEKPWRMADAPADEAWTCGECGAVASQWSATCGNCGSLASVDWRRPPRVSFVMAPTLTEGAIDADSGADSGSERPLLETP